MQMRRISCFVSLLTILTASASAQWTVINLHPAGATESRALGGSGANQVGMAVVGGNSHASLWSGAAASWEDLHPSGATTSYAWGSSGAHQVGYARSGASRASLWFGTAASWVDISPSGVHAGIEKSSGANQVGYVSEGFGYHASLWSGTAASWVDMHPAGTASSVALDLLGASQVGYARINGGGDHASLWFGTAASWVDLNPAGAYQSKAYGITGANQVGYAAASGGDLHASLWSGTTASWVDLHPAGATRSTANSALGKYQVGFADISALRHASLWSGTAASWVDLHSFVPGEFSESTAWYITTDGTNYYIAGSGFNTATEREEALLWVSPVPVILPDSFSMYRGFLTGGGLSELFASDDQKLSARAGATLFPGESPLQFIVTGTSPVAVPSELHFTLEANASTPGLTQTLLMMNYDTGLYEEVDFWVGTPSDSIVEVGISTNPERFVQAGTREMKAKLVYTQVGAVLQWPWSAGLDQTIWRIIP